MEKMPSRGEEIDRLMSKDNVNSSRITWILTILCAAIPMVLEYFWGAISMIFR